MNHREPCDQDMFSFQAEGGKTYSIVVTPGTLEVPLLTLWDPIEGIELSGNILNVGTTLGSSRTQYTAPLDGTYVVQVERSGFSRNGTYALTINTVEGELSEQGS